MVDKSKPDVLRVTEFVMSKSERKEEFSVSEAAETKELNGIHVRRIAEILNEICLEPAGPNSKQRLTTVNSSYSHSEQGSWTLSSTAYFGYLTYQSNLHAKEASIHAKYALWLAALSFVGSIVIGIWSIMATS